MFVDGLHDRQQVRAKPSKTCPVSYSTQPSDDDSRTCVQN